MVRTLLVFTLGIFCFVAAPQVFAEDRPALAIAKVLGKEIYAADVAPNPLLAANSKKDMSAEEFSRWEKDYKMQVLGGRILSACSEKFLRDMKMEPTESEVQRFVDRFERREKNAEDLQREKKDRERMPNYEAVKRESLNRVAHSAVGAWKFNKALYQKYGGRVIFQQAGMEPIDAYKQFLKSISDDRSYEILDPAYAGVFAKMQQYFEMPHTFLSQEDADEHFKTPWWEQAEVK